MNKRLCGIITAVSCSIGILGYMPQYSMHTYAEEIVSNTFETSYGGWYENGDYVSLHSENGIGINGSKGMKVTGRRSPNDGTASDKHFYLTGGVCYDYSVKLMSNSYDKFHLWLSFNCGGTEQKVELSSKEVKGGLWIDLSANYTAPEDAENLTLMISTDSVNDFVFDDVSVKTKTMSDGVYAADSQKGLKDEFAGYFRVGNTLNSKTVKDSNITNALLKEYNSVTCPNELKPDFTMVQSTSSNNKVGVSLKNAAAIMDFCVEHNIGMRGHTLVWHSQTPTWFFKKDFVASNGWVDEATMDIRLESYIQGMFRVIREQYPDLNLYAYDVCNECIANSDKLFNVNGGAREPGDDKSQSGKSAWVQIYKDNHFVEKAFRFAKKYAPEGCALYYNDYNEYWGGKQDDIYNLCKSLYEKGLLNGIGMQSHVAANATGFGGTDAYISAMKRFLSIGCDVQITELDVNLKDNTYTLQDQANKYKAIFKAAMDWNDSPKSTGRVTAICMWGMNDSLSWIGSSNKPLLYDSDNQPKLAYYTLTGLIPESQWGNGSGGPAVSLPDENGYYYIDHFDDKTGEWKGRGSASVQLTKSEHYESEGSLFVDNRTASWNGTEKQLDTRIYECGKSYSFSVNVKYSGDDAYQPFFLKLQYKDASDETHYDTVAECTAANGSWAQLCNTHYTLPDGATNLKIYVETESGTSSFYIDEAVCAIGDKVIEGAGQPELTITGDVNMDRKFDAADVLLMQKWFLGVSESELADSKAADLNKDDRLDVLDFCLIKQLLIGDWSLP